MGGSMAMKQKNSDMVMYIFLSVVAVIIVGLIIVFIRNSLNSTMDTANHLINEQEQTTSEIEEYSIMKYDNEEVRGSEVVNFIKKYLGDYSNTETAPIYVKVTTVTSGVTYNNTYTNGGYISDIKNFSSNQYYIKPTAWFTGKVIRTKNKAILGVTFTKK
jgi:type II secretory pathway pseudopilin PulG